MEHIGNVVKSVFVGIGAFLSVKLGSCMYLLLMLIASMVIDYITGVYNAGMKGEVSSKAGWVGIIKKLMYMVAVGIGFGVDFLIKHTTSELGYTVNIGAFFGSLVTIWLILNEWTSTLENIGEIGVPLPKFLTNAISSLKSLTERSGESVQIKEENK